MFDDFGQKNACKEGRGRRSLSAILSVGVFASLASGVGGAIAAHKVREYRAPQDVDVSFEAIPKPRAHRPKPHESTRSKPSRPRKAASRKPIVAPKAVPAATPAEAEGDLAETEATGPIDGSIDDLGEGFGSGEAVAQASSQAHSPPAPVPPAQERDSSIVRPRFVSGCRTPEVPEALHKAAATIEIDVRMMIGSDGRVTDAKVVKSHPLVPDELVLSCVNAQVFEPAHLPDGTAVPFPFRRRFLFRPA